MFGIEKSSLIVVIFNLMMNLIATCIGLIAVKTNYVLGLIAYVILQVIPLVLGLVYQDYSQVISVVTIVTAMVFIATVIARRRDRYGEHSSKLRRTSQSNEIFQETTQPLNNNN